MRNGWAVTVLLATLSVAFVHGDYLLAGEVYQKWAFDTGGGVVSSPTVGSDGTIYLGSNDGHLYAIRPDGTLRWKFETKGAVHSRPAIGADGTIYVGSWDHYLYAINPNGSLKWRFETQAEVNSSPTIGADGTIYVGSWDHHLYAVDPNGNLKWMFATKDAVFSSPSIGPDGTLYIASWDQHLYAIEDRPGGVVSRPKPAVKETVTIAEKPETAAQMVAKPTQETKPAVKEEKTPRQFKEIKAIDFGTTPDGEEWVSITLNEPVQPQFFALGDGRPRLVCDFYGTYLGTGIRQRIQVNGNVIKQIRIGFYRGPKSKVRVVLDLEANRDYEARQVLSQEEGRYTVIVKPSNRR